MKCQKCGNMLVIDAWNGWVWTCLNCGFVSRKATYEETDQQEKEIEEYLKKSRKVREKNEKNIGNHYGGCGDTSVSNR